MTGSGPGMVDRRLLDAIVGVAEGLELEPTLRRIVSAAADLTGAPYAALGVLGEDRLHRAFVHTGMAPATVAAIGHLPEGHGVLGHITRVGRPVRVPEIGQHPASVGFPAHHPPMGSFLGVPVGIGSRVIGNLYLSDKTGGFSAEDEDVVVALAAAAAVAVENAELFEAARRRGAWVQAAADLTTAMLSGAEEDEALQLVAARARELGEAEVCALVLPSLDGQLLVELADGPGSQQLIGSSLPGTLRTTTELAGGHALRVLDLSTEPALAAPRLKRYGPALFVPLVVAASEPWAAATAPEAPEQLGVLLLLRGRGAPAFNQVDQDTARTFGGQAALALQLAQARRRGEEAELLEERARIARDLHDLVIQELFAMGMRLHRLGEDVPAPVAADIAVSLESLDRAVRQIRSTIRSLRDPQEPGGLVERLHALCARSRSTLGFAPTVTVQAPPDWDVDAVVGPDVADDAIAVVREGLSNAARHARPAHVAVQLAVTEDELRLSVQDDGTGLDPSHHRGSGLDNLAERARRHQGSFSIDSPAAGGTCLTWQVPTAP